MCCNLLRAPPVLDSLLFPTSSCQRLYIVKIGNVFLGSCSNSKFRGYPAPKLGDFGFALLAPGGTCDQQDVSYAGTRANLPAEQSTRPPVHHFVGEGTKPMTSQTNVWGVGMIIWSFMCQDEGDRAIDYVNGPREPTFRLPRPTDVYSEELKELVMQCCRYRPEDRISFAALLEEARRHASGAGSLRDVPGNDRRWHGRSGLGLDEEKYRVGSALNDGPLPEGKGSFPDPPGEDEDDDSDSDNADLGGPEGMEFNMLERPGAEAEAEADLDY